MENVTLNQILNVVVDMQKDMKIIKGEQVAIRKEQQGIKEEQTKIKQE